MLNTTMSATVRLYNGVAPKSTQAKPLGYKPVVEREVAYYPPPGLTMRAVDLVVAAGHHADQRPGDEHGWVSHTRAGVQNMIEEDHFEQQARTSRDRPSGGKVPTLHRRWRVEVSRKMGSLQERAHTTTSDENRLEGGGGEAPAPIDTQTGGKGTSTRQPTTHVPVRFARRHSLCVRALLPIFSFRRPSGRR